MSVEQLIAYQAGSFFESELLSYYWDNRGLSLFEE